LSVVPAFRSEPGCSATWAEPSSSIQAANQADRDYVEAVNKRWTGIKEPHFRRCALRARENNLPGVTVLAVGAVRAKIVLQCLKLGLINHLILDTDCADELQGLAR
jgi:hypothetical protein